jgi:hypothetical protein
MAKFYGRDAATQFLREQGVVLSDSALNNLAWGEAGPRYQIVNGRCLYKPADLLAWIKKAARPPLRERRKAARK